MDTIKTKDMFEKSLRTIKAQNKVFSAEQMEKYRIRGIYNSFGYIEDMGDKFIMDFARRSHRPERGEIAIIESGIKEKDGMMCKVVSVIVFEDIWSWQMFAIRFKGIYLKSIEDLYPILN